MAFAERRDCGRLYIGASEQPFGSFATGWLYSEYASGRYQLTSEDARDFARYAWTRHSPKRPLSEHGVVRLGARSRQNRQRPRHVDGQGNEANFRANRRGDHVILFYAHLIAEIEGAATKVEGSPLWRVAYMSPADVHTALLRLHQFKRLDYQVAGSLIQLGRRGSARSPTRKHCKMNDFIQRLRRDLEPILAMADPREKISAYHDMPYTIFHYDRRRNCFFVARSGPPTRIENKGKRVTTISLAECLEEAMKSEETPEDWFENQRMLGSRRPPRTSTSFSPTGCRGRTRRGPDARRSRSAEGRRLHRPDRARCSRSTGRSRCWSNSRAASSSPTVLFYPGDLDGAAGLRFMGVLEAEHNYRPKIF